MGCLMDICTGKRSSNQVCDRCVIEVCVRVCVCVCLCVCVYVCVCVGDKCRCVGVTVYGTLGSGCRVGCLMDICTGKRSSNQVYDRVCARVFGWCVCVCVGGISAGVWE